MLVAKIETAEAIENLDAIVRSADAVMVARGDLGIRLPLEDVPFHQKEIIRCGVRFARPVITATQMLESMITSPVPTRAEVSDVANAILDGTSAVMLSGETAIGADPANVVATMSRIVERRRARVRLRQLGCRPRRAGGFGRRPATPDHRRHHRCRLARGPRGGRRRHRRLHPVGGDGRGRYPGSAPACRSWPSRRTSGRSASCR